MLRVLGLSGQVLERAGLRVPKDQGGRSRAESAGAQGSRTAFAGT